ncbi:MAG: DUF1493 family protein [Pseudomonadota bacterium]
MNAAQPLWPALTAFVQEQTGAEGPFTRGTDLAGDLGLDGDEAFDFVEAYAERFSVAPGDFEFHRYFGAEGFNPLALIAGLFRRAEAKAPLTLGMLEAAAQQGQWNTAQVERGGGSAGAV